MKKSSKIKSICVISLMAAVVILLCCSNAFCDASFEGSQKGLERNSFDIFGAQIEDLAVDLSGNTYAIALAPNGVFCLPAGTDQWSDPVAGTDLGNPAGLAVGSTAGTAFIIGGTSLFRTTDACQTWTELVGSSGSAESNDYGFQIEYAHNTLLVETRAGTLDRSTDNGDTFSNVSVVSGAQDIIDIASSPTSGEFYLLAKSNDTVSLYRSTDSGASWTNIGKSGDFAGIAVDGGDATRLALSTNSGGVELSTNSGAGWSILNPPDTSKKSVVFINSRLFKGSAFTDNTTDWQLLPETSSGADIVGPVAGDPTNNSVLYAGSELGVARSGDGGATLGDRVSGLYALRVHDIVQKSDKNIVFLATEQGLARTNNFLSESGPTWTIPIQISSSRAYQAVYSLHIDGTDENRLYAGLVGGEMYYSTDGGSSWSPSTIDSIGGADILDIEQTDDGVLFAAYASRDSNSGGVLRSNDNGLTWSIISNGLINIDCNSISAVGNTIFIGAGDDTDQSNSSSGLYKFDGSSITKVTGVTDGQIITAVARSGSTVIAASAADSDQSGGVFRSTDSGNTWSEVTTKGLRENGGWYRTLAVDPANPDIIFVAHGRPAGTAEIYYSQDKGATWGLMYEGLTDEVPEAMLVDDLTVGSGVGFTGVNVRSSVRVSLLIKKRNVLATLRDGNSSLGGQKVSIEIKKKGGFVRSQTKSTNSKGKATFKLNKLKKGTQVRVRFITKVSKAKRPS